MSVNLGLQWEELLLAPILDNIADGLVIVDAALKIVLINPTAEELLDLKSSELIGKSCSRISPYLDFERIIRHAENSYSTTIRANQRDFVVHMGPIGEENRRSGAYAIVRPAENLSQLQLESFLENPYEGVLILDPQGVVTYGNRPCYEFFHCDSLEKLRGAVEPFSPNAFFNRALQTGKPVSGDPLVIREQKVDVTYLPFNEEDMPAGVIVKCRLASQKRDWNYYIERIAQGSASYFLADIAGQDPALIQQKEQARRAARTLSTILIMGETGTGKEIFAHAIHNASPRRLGPFIKVNCAAVPEALLESELFGYTDGAFTGAKKGGKPGKFELANRGSIFLDEIADMSLSMQAKLLRVLQEREFERVGGVKPIRIDVRIIAATNRDLTALVTQGKFREDLYYRLNVIALRLPPLRERRPDIQMLAKHLLTRLNASLGTEVNAIAPSVLDCFEGYDWPGNIREMENALERAVNFCDHGVIEMEHLPDHLRNQKSTRLKSANAGDLDQIRSEAERAMILEALHETNWNKTQAAERLHIHRSVLYRKMQKYRITGNEITVSH